MLVLGVGQGPERRANAGGYLESRPRAEKACREAREGFSRAPVQPNRNTSLGSMLAEPKHQLWPVYALCRRMSASSLDPHDRHTICGDQVRRREHRVERGIVMGFH